MYRRNKINKSVYYQSALIFLSLIIFLLQFSCQRKTEKIPGLEVTIRSKINKKLIIEDTLQIPVDSVTNPANYYGQIKYQDGDTLYVIFNDNINAIQAYSLSTNQLVWKLIFPKEGPREVRENSRFYYYNRDSIFFFSQYPYNEVKLFNHSAELINAWHIDLAKPYDNYWISLDIFGEFKYCNTTKSVVFAIYPNISPSEDLRFYEQARLCSYNLTTNESKVFGGFPGSFYATDALYYVFEYIEFYLMPGKLVAYYHPSSEVFTYEMPDFNPKLHIVIPSRFMKKATRPFMYLGEEEPDAQQEGNYMATEPFYAKMITNQSGSIHYRIVKQRAPLRNDDGKLRNFYDRPFSIMALDEDFNTIDEIKLVGGQYDFYQVFALDSRFYLSYNNPLNNSSSDTNMQFVVYSLN